MEYKDNIMECRIEKDLGLKCVGEAVSAVGSQGKEKLALVSFSSLDGQKMKLSAWHNFPGLVASKSPFSCPLFSF